MKKTAALVAMPRSRSRLGFGEMRPDDSKLADHGEHDEAKEGDKRPKCLLSIANVVCNRAEFAKSFGC